jgi:hypothetical protein
LKICYWCWTRINSTVKIAFIKYCNEFNIEK